MRVARSAGVLAGRSAGVSPARRRDGGGTATGTVALQRTAHTIALRSAGGLAGGTASGSLADFNRRRAGGGPATEPVALRAEALQ